MRSIGADIRIVVSTSLANSVSANYVGERLKYVIGDAKLITRWIAEKLDSPEWMERVVFTQDKTILKADFLIDDEPFPELTGEFEPSWEHILFDQPYNRGIKDKKR